MRCECICVTRLHLCIRVHCDEVPLCKTDKVHYCAGDCKKDIICSSFALFLHCIKSRISDWFSPDAQTHFFLPSHFRFCSSENKESLLYTHSQKPAAWDATKLLLRCVKLDAKHTTSFKLLCVWRCRFRSIAQDTKKTCSDNISRIIWWLKNC